MGALEKLNFFFSTVGRAIISLFNFRLWPPFFIYMIVMAVLVLMITYMFSPLLAGWLIPLVIALTNESILHYPQHMGYLPLTFQFLNLATSLLLESLLVAAGILMFAAYFRRETPSFSVSIKRAWANYPKIFLIWLVNAAIIVLLLFSLPQLFRDFVHGSPRREMALSLGMLGLYVLVSSLFVYVIPYLLIRGRSFGKSFTESFSLFFRNFFITVFFVGVPALVTWLANLPLNNVNTIVTKFNPELILSLTLGLVVVLTIMSFLTYGCIVRFFLEVSEE